MSLCRQCAERFRQAYWRGRKARERKATLGHFLCVNVSQLDFDYPLLRSSQLNCLSQIFFERNIC